MLKCIMLYIELETRLLSTSRICGIYGEKGVSMLWSWKT